MEVIGVGRPERRDRSAGLRPRTRGRRVGMDDPADLRDRRDRAPGGSACPRTAAARPRPPARRRSSTATSCSARVRITCHAARLDEHHATPAVEPAGVAERQRHEARFHERLVGAPDRFADGTRPTVGHTGAAQAAGQMVVGLVPADLVLERRHADVLVDQQQLDAGHLGKVDQWLGVDRAGSGPCGGRRRRSATPRPAVGRSGRGRQTARATGSRGSASVRLDDVDRRWRRSGSGRPGRSWPPRSPVRGRRRTRAGPDPPSPDRQRVDLA